MAVIVQSDPYQSLIRKVGYSVGLESLVKRATALVHLYAEQRALSVTAWTELVVKEFGRKESDQKDKKSSAGHIADFFGELHLIKITGQQITPLHGLEVLSILWRYLTTSEAQQRAITFVLSAYLLEADGDVFLNLLNTSFEEQEGRRSLERMIARKRELLSTAIRHPALQQKIFDVVSIKSQVQPKRKTGTTGAVASAFSHRTDPLSLGKRKEPLNGISEAAIIISSDYMRKAVQTRKGWARDLGLFGEDALTEDGTRLLAEMRRLGLWNSAGVYLFWPFERDLSRLQIDARAIEAPQLSEWNLLVGLFRCSNLAVLDDGELHSTEGVIDFLRTFQQLYKEGNRATGSIRHLLPLYVAQPVIAASCIATRRPLPPVPAIVNREMRSAKRRIEFGNIRGTEGGVSVRN